MYGNGMSTSGRMRMSVTLRTAGPSDLESVANLLSTEGLPTAGVPVGLEGFVVAESAGEVIGLAGLECYGSAGLLRSVAVKGTARGSGVGSALVERILGDAAACGITDVYLLTTTAESYFPRHGFARIEREAVPKPLHASAEFQGACPASAVIMHRRVPSSSGT
jgi:amino-acid N-acetyltransferase